MTKYFSSQRYEVLENKVMILIYKRVFWTGNLSFREGFNKKFFSYKEDEKEHMIIIKEKKQKLNSLKEVNNDGGKFFSSQA